ncbi:MAG: hypothetical protein IKQ10_07550 [Oscillospiraceae bacterium]|nr:hypothetical protein [Oscillospiraceae bacterium]
MDKAQQYLGLARKAGLLAVGEDNCSAAVSGGRAKLLLLASDASPNARKRAEGFLHGHRALLEPLPWTKEELSALLGKRGCSMVCFTDLGLASQFAGAMAASESRWQETAALLVRRKEKAVRRKAAPRKHQQGG